MTFSGHFSGPHAFGGFHKLPFSGGGTFFGFSFRTFGGFTLSQSLFLRELQFRLSLGSLGFRLLACGFFRLTPGTFGSFTLSLFDAVTLCTFCGFLAKPLKLDLLGFSLNCRLN
jgi:hypothetical protein